MAACFEECLLTGEKHGAAAKLKNITNLMRVEPNNYLELSLSYAQAGLFRDALQILEADERDLLVQCNLIVSYYKCWLRRKIRMIQKL